MNGRILGQSLPSTIRDIQQKANDFSVVPITYKGDWYEISEPVTYTNSTTITVDNPEVDLTRLFSPGTIIRLKQGGNYKYFYVYGVTTNTIRITGGTSYTLVSAGITDFAKAISAVPTGFPYVLSYNANPRTIGTTLSDLQSPSYKFWMTGPICYIDLHFDNGDLSGNNSSIFCDLPIQASLDADVPIYPCLAINDFNPNTAIAKIGTLGTELEVQVISDSGFSQWLASTNGTGMDVTLAYIIEI